jgi:hypothetical protein
MNVLGLILDIGNYMNDSNKQANGFKLSSLARLGMVKDDKMSRLCRPGRKDCTKPVP